MTSYYPGFLGFIVLILDIWAMVNILGSPRTTIAKVFWAVVVLLLPVVGFILWLVFGPRAVKHL